MITRRTTPVKIVEEFNDPRIRFFGLHDFPEFINPPAFKKSAITLAVSKARYDHILMTDADCHVGPQWLTAHAEPLEREKNVFQTGPVVIDTYSSALEKMQAIELNVLMMVTSAGLRSGFHTLANGANMLFSKKAFQEVGGYEGNIGYASGDDLFLAEKMNNRFPGQLSFVQTPDAIVRTTGKATWSELLQQRLRWAGKNDALTDFSIRYVWIFVGLVHVALVVFLSLALFHLISWWAFILLLMLKWISDLLLLFVATGFTDQRSLLRFFIPGQVFYTYYILRLAGEMMMGKKGDWEVSDR